MLAPPLILFLSHSNRVLPKHLANANMVASGSAPLGADDLERLRTKLPPGNTCITFQGKVSGRFVFQMFLMSLFLKAL